MGNYRGLAGLCHLAVREHSVTERCRLVGLSQSALSQHLAKLRRDHLVKTRRSAQTVYYSVASPEVAPLLRSLSQVFAPGGGVREGSAGEGVPERPCGAERAHEPAADGGLRRTQIGRASRRESV